MIGSTWAALRTSSSKARAPRIELGRNGVSTRTAIGHGRGLQGGPQVSYARQRRDVEEVPVAEAMIHDGRPLALLEAREDRGVLRRGDALERGQLRHRAAGTDDLIERFEERQFLPRPEEGRALLALPRFAGRRVSRKPGSARGRDHSVRRWRSPARRRPCAPTPPAPAPDSAADNRRPPPAPCNPSTPSR